MIMLVSATIALAAIRGTSGGARRTPSTPGAPTGSMLDRFGTPWRRRHDNES